MEQCEYLCDHVLHIARDCQHHIVTTNNCSAHCCWFGALNLTLLHTFVSCSASFFLHSFNVLSVGMKWLLHAAFDLLRNTSLYDNASGRNRLERSVKFTHSSPFLKKKRTEKCVKSSI